MTQESKLSLRSEGLYRSLTEIALEVQKARTVRDVLLVAGAGLESLGFEVVVVRADSEQYEVRYSSPGSVMSAIQEALRKRFGGLPREVEAMEFRFAAEHGESLLWSDFRARVSTYLRNIHAEEEAQRLIGQVKRAAAIVPLNMQNRTWGVAVLTHDALTKEHLSSLGLFALQLGSSIEVATTIERLEQRHSELEMVHALAVADPRADAKALCERALETLAQTTGSTAASLHVYEPEQRAYVRVGRTWGSLSVAFTERYRVIPGGRDFPSGEVASMHVDTLADAAALRAEGLRYLLQVPFRSDGALAGVLTLARAEDRPYAANDVRTAEILTVQVSALLERGRLYDEASRLYVNWKQSYDELARTQAELVRHERLAALGELAAVMAHEVRNPLGVIFNSLNALKRVLKPAGDAEMLLTMVGEEAERLNRIVGDLLDFARPYELVKKPIAIGPVIASAVDSAMKTVNAPNVRVEVQLPDELPPFPVDPHLVRQALVNLVVNGAQAMPKGGALTVRARCEAAVASAGPWLVIEVCDQGVGLPVGAGEKMFQPFFTTKATGTGLGLALVKRIVDAHQGEVTATPNAHGVGTTFVCRFPNQMDARGLTPTPPQLAMSRRSPDSD